MKTKRVLMVMLVVAILSLPIGMVKQYGNDPFPWSIGYDITYNNSK